MLRKTKIIFALLLFVTLSIVMYSSLKIKNYSIRELYEEVTFMRITVEARQYVKQIENGIKNGRQLDNFYNMQEALKGIQRCSSYMDGAYIISKEAKLLYESGTDAEILNLMVPLNQTYSNGRLYEINTDSAYFYITTPIKNGSEQVEGYLIMCISKNAVNNAVLDYNSQNSLQSTMIAFEVFGIALFILIRIIHNDKKKLALRLMMLLSITIVFAAVIDSVMVYARFYQIVDDATHQTANKMAQALQSDVDSVIAKGVPTERIYDLNGWLAKNSSELEIVTSLSLDRNNKIIANVSKAYTNSFLRKLSLRMVLLVFICGLSGAVACVFLFILMNSGKYLKIHNKIYHTKGISHA